MDFEKFYDIADYANKHWKGDFTPKEVAKNAFEYLDAYNSAKEPFEDKTIFNLLSLLLEDATNGSEEALAYAKEIVDGLSN